MGTIIELRKNTKINITLHDELDAVIKQEKYNDLYMAEVIGVLEFLKWNLINNTGDNVKE